ncbi:hypothetical protein ACF1CG_36995 [Streptomyces sp. NPDC014773]|uniref:hypothetical protein n=1 Tax=Streptomyces sp. NPDC014773 TaxID=3364908 RepID=UPI0036F949FB
MEEQKTVRYVIGKHAASGHYAVSVDGIPSGTIHRRHKVWFATVPGTVNDGRFTNRFDAAEYHVYMYDLGIRPKVPAQAPAPLHTPTPATFLLPDLRLTVANVVRAAEAMARLAQLGWEPLEGYPGADQPWLLRCRLCGWEGHRFWSHLRGRNGDMTPRPAHRHDGCIPTPEFPAALIALAAERTRECPCDSTHPATIEGAIHVINRLDNALIAGNGPRALAMAAAMLEPCPATTRRAEMLRHALTIRGEVTKGRRRRA